MSFNFDISSLNVRGIRDLKKRKKIFYWLKKHGSDNGITFLQETYSSKEVESQWTEHFKGKIIFDHGSSHSRGVAVLFGSSLDYKIVDKVTSNEGRFIILKAEIQGKECILINSYLPNLEKDQVTLLKSVITKIENIGARDCMAIIWGGDFNLCFDLNLEAVGGNPKLKVSSLEQLKAIKQELDLCDIWRVRYPQTKGFTWSGSAQGKCSYKKQKLYRRLDYFFVSDSMQTDVKEVKIIVAPGSDHSALFMKINSLPDNRYGPSFWKFNTSLLKDRNYCEKIKEVIDQTKRDFNETNANLCWEMLKYEIRKASIIFSKAKAKKTRNSIKEGEKEIEEIEKIDKWYEDATLVGRHTSAKTRLNEYYDHITEGMMLRSKVLWIEQGEKSNKYFLNLEKKRKSKTHVRKLINDQGQEITDPNIILENLWSFYAGIYEKKNNYSVSECLNFISQASTTAKLNEVERKKMDGLLSVKECFDSLLSMKDGKTPGNDGIPKEFYVQFWNELGKEMTSSFNYSYEKGLLSNSQRQVIVTLLEKTEKDVRYIENWRPISLINVDVKVCSKALADRMLNVLPKLIHPNQAAFVKGRNIEEPLRYISDLFELSIEYDLSYILFAADFKKAFDSVEHNFIFATLLHFGFGEDFIRWVRLLLEDVKSCVLNNGTASDFLPLNRGTKQGDPISPYLFILVIEILAELIRNDKEVNGVKFSNLIDDTKVVLFADDATFTLKDGASLDRCLDILKKYGNFSSLQINFEKSEVGWIGRRNDLNLLSPLIKKKINLHKEGIRILGVFFSHDQDLMNRNNVERGFEKFKSILNIWKQRQLTLYGKSIIVRALALSQLQFIFSNTWFPKQYIKKVQDEIVKFLWNGKKAKVKYSALINDYDKGGIKLPDLETMIIANRVRWAIKFINSDKEDYWRLVADKWLDRIGGMDTLIENFDKKMFFAMNNKLPKFYKELFHAWSAVSQIEINTNEDVLRQSVWLNEKIKLNTNVETIKTLKNRGIVSLRQIWTAKKPSWRKAKEIGWEEKEYIIWRSVIDAIPKEWKTILRNFYIDKEGDNKPKFICVGNELCPLSKAKSKVIYSILIQTKRHPPTSQKNIEKKLHSSDIDWPSVYSLIYTTTIDTKLRAFEYKIINNYLYLNQKLCTFGVTDSPNCSFCEKEPETLIHFFLECPFTKEFYIECRNWLKQGGVTFPKLTLGNILLGYIEDSFVNFLFVLWKWLLYNSRFSHRRPGLGEFQGKILWYRKVECHIAEKKGKINTHLKKYEKINNLLTQEN